MILLKFRHIIRNIKDAFKIEGYSMKGFFATLATLAFLFFCRFYFSQKKRNKKPSSGKQLDGLYFFENHLNQPNSATPPICSTGYGRTYAETEKSSSQVDREEQIFDCLAYLDIGIRLNFRDALPFLKVGAPLTRDAWAGGFISYSYPLKPNNLTEDAPLLYLLVQQERIPLNQWCKILDIHDAFIEKMTPAEQNEYKKCVYYIDSNGNSKLYMPTEEDIHAKDWTILLIP